MCLRYLYNVNMTNGYAGHVCSGSTHSGHYTAYIRDVDNLGNWTHPVMICNCFIIQLTFV